MCIRDSQSTLRWPAAPKRLVRNLYSSEIVFDLAGKLTQIAAIENEMAAPGFWDNQEKAQQIIADLKSLKAIADPISELKQAEADLEALLEMVSEDPSITEEVDAEICRLESLVADLELKSLLSGPHDAAGAIMTINARDGGTDANDWAEMLLRMYIQWAH